MKEENNHEKKKHPAIVPVRFDRHTVVYARREKVEELGGKEAYIRWFNKNRMTFGDINSLAKW
ncbi:MAG: hypothetical protein LBC19_04655 [Tannerella sp.]|jgi:hypothetical protein|nr:hypothetical protein [Tannerella sp.]